MAKRQGDPEAKTVAGFVVREKTMLGVTNSLAFQTREMAQNIADGRNRVNPGCKAKVIALKGGKS